MKRFLSCFALAAGLSACGATAPAFAQGELRPLSKTVACGDIQYVLGNLAADGYRITRAINSKTGAVVVVEKDRSILVVEVPKNLPSTACVVVVGDLNPEV